MINNCEITGKVIFNNPYFKNNQIDEHVITLETKDGTRELFSAYSMQITDARKVKSDDLVTITYKKCGKGKQYNRIDSIEVHKNKVNTIITGEISNLNNVRGARGKQVDEICFCLKQRGNKVFYCYANKNLTESMYFFKGSLVQLEVIKEERINNRDCYKVIFLWKI